MAEWFATPPVEPRLAGQHVLDAKQGLAVAQQPVADGAGVGAIQHVAQIVEGNAEQSRGGCFSEVIAAQPHFLQVVQPEQGPRYAAAQPVAVQLQDFEPLKGAELPGNVAVEARIREMQLLHARRSASQCNAPPSVDRRHSAPVQRAVAGKDIAPGEQRGAILKEAGI